MADFNVNTLAVSGTNVFAGTVDRVFYSTDNGKSWPSVIFSVNTNIHCLLLSGANLFVGCNDGLFLSTNNGTNWTKVSTGLPSVITALAISVDGKTLFAGTPSASNATGGDGVYRSTDNGGSWKRTCSGLTKTHINCFASIGTSLFTGTSGGVFLSTNEGETWTAVNNGLTGAIAALGVSGTSLFAWEPPFFGPPEGKVWRRPLVEMITSVEAQAGGLPHEFLLRQNYPNPFNPSTTITFELPRTSSVNLSVYNTLGIEVATLVNGQMPTGIHTVQFNGSGLASGVYYYRLRTGEFIQTRKLVLVK